MQFLIIARDEDGWFLDGIFAESEEQALDNARRIRTNAEIYGAVLLESVRETIANMDLVARDPQLRAALISETRPQCGS